MALECVNEEFQHYFVVDTPPSTPVKKKKKSVLNYFIKLFTPKCLSMSR